ncbi:MAG: hypothetical protein ACI81P_000981 [Neolewinella sp.]|jgi:hypothetical protein
MNNCGAKKARMANFSKSGSQLQSKTAMQTYNKINK